MGQLRQAHRPVGTKPGLTYRGKMLPPLLLGFTVSAIAVFATVSLAGSALRSTHSLGTNLIVVPVLSLCFASDIVFPRMRRTLFRRQAPLSFAGRFPAPITGLLWGLDTGTVISTFRTSAASWAALMLAFAGWTPLWGGVAYAGGFCLPLGFLILTHRATRDDGGESLRTRSTESLVPVLLSRVSHVRYAAAVATLVGIVLAAEAAL
jgi:hypothetical protein